MSPAVARTSREEIVAAARALVEEGGPDAVTMASVAERVGVRAPSLYKRVRDRSALIEAVAIDVADDLAGALAAADPGPSAAADARLVALADAYRAFAARDPRATAMLFGDLGLASAEWSAANERAARPILAVTRALVGDDLALPAARVATAYVHGFTSMETAGAFRLGDDAARAFRLGLRALSAGLRAEAPRPRAG